MEDSTAILLDEIVVANLYIQIELPDCSASKFNALYYFSICAKSEGVLPTASDCDYFATNVDSSTIVEHQPSPADIVSCNLLC